MMPPIDAKRKKEKRKRFLSVVAFRDLVNERRVNPFNNRDRQILHRHLRRHSTTREMLLEILQTRRLAMADTHHRGVEESCGISRLNASDAPSSSLVTTASLFLESGLRGGTQRPTLSCGGVTIGRYAPRLSRRGRAHRTSGGRDYAARSGAYYTPSG